MAAVYYPNPHWLPAHGGLLRCYPLSAGGPVDIAPQMDRLVVFRADVLLHAVTPYDPPPPQVLTPRQGPTPYPTPSPTTECLSPSALSSPLSNACPLRRRRAALRGTAAAGGGRSWSGAASRRPALWRTPSRSRPRRALPPLHLGCADRWAIGRQPRLPSTPPPAHRPSGSTPRWHGRRRAPLRTAALLQMLPPPPQLAAMAAMAGNRTPSVVVPNPLNSPQPTTCGLLPSPPSSTVHPSSGPPAAAAGHPAIQSAAAEHAALLRAALTAPPPARPLPPPH